MSVAALSLPLDWPTLPAATPTSEPEPEPALILTCRQGTNADQWPDVLAVYVPPGSLVADCTWGRGIFWRKVTPGRYDVLGSDYQDRRAETPPEQAYRQTLQADYRRLPYRDGSLDALCFDPPYGRMGSHRAGSQRPMARQYGLELVGGMKVIRQHYQANCVEAFRVLRPGGIYAVKCQDCIEWGGQQWMHVEVRDWMTAAGFIVEDLFVLHSDSIPWNRYPDRPQQHARKNHSYMLVGRKPAERRVRR